VYGFYVSSKKLEKAHGEVAPALREMLHLNYALKCDVKPTASFGEFIAHHRRGTAAADQAAGDVAEETTYVVEQKAA